MFLSSPKNDIRFHFQPLIAWMETPSKYSQEKLTVALFRVCFLLYILICSLQNTIRYKLLRILPPSTSDHLLTTHPISKEDPVTQKNTKSRSNKRQSSSI